MMRRLLATAACAALLATLPGCGLRPLYAGGGSGAVARGLGTVAVGPIAGRAGFLTRSALTERLGGDGAGPAGGAARYRLDVALDNRLEGLGLLPNDAITRERLSLRARYQLVDLTTGVTLLDKTAGSDAGIDVVSSEYATIAAENTALENLSRAVADQIVTALAVELRARR